MLTKRYFACVKKARISRLNAFFLFASFHWFRGCLVGKEIDISKYVGYFDIEHNRASCL